MNKAPRHLAKNQHTQQSAHEGHAAHPRHLKTTPSAQGPGPQGQADEARRATRPTIPSVTAPATAPPSKPKAKRKRKKWPVVLVVVIVLLALAGGSAFAWSRGYLESTPVGPLSDRIATLIVGERFDTEGLENGVMNGIFRQTNDECKTILSDGEEAAEYQLAHDGFPTPLVAEYDGVLIHTPVHVRNLNGILFHQAATKYGLPLETKLPEADEEKVYKTKSYDFAKPEDQPEGDEYLKGKALHLWRRWTPTEMDSSIDVGAEAGDQVYAPVTGTVVLVRTYRLYDTCDDYEIHIQPDGRDDLDVVEIHITDVSVKAGDKVVGGVTPMAKVRDLAKEKITDIQLAFYTKPGHGNHTHVQVNDVNWKDKDGKTYREFRLKDAVKV